MKARCSPSAETAASSMVPSSSVRASRTAPVVPSMPTTEREPISTSRSSAVQAVLTRWSSGSAWGMRSSRSTSPEARSTMRIVPWPESGTARSPETGWCAGQSPAVSDPPLAARGVLVSPTNPTRSGWVVSAVARASAVWAPGVRRAASAARSMARSGLLGASRFASATRRPSSLDRALRWASAAAPRAWPRWFSAIAPARTATTSTIATAPMSRRRRWFWRSCWALRTSRSRRS